MRALTEATAVVWAKFLEPVTALLDALSVVAVVAVFPVGASAVVMTETLQKNAKKGP